MKNISLFILILLFISCSQFSPLTNDTTNIKGNSMQLQTIFENPAILEQVRLSLKDNHSQYQPALIQLIIEADALLKTRPTSVMDKKQVPPSGDKHDYMSLARYFWPDPNKPDGLPYINRDGEVNPEIYSITDHENLLNLCSNVHTLSLAYYFTGEQKYAQHAATMIKVWFLNPETKMNPNLNFAQGIKGVNNGRPIGLIETRDIGLIAEAANLISSSKSWADKDQKELKQWFSQYLNWLLTSENGIEEAKTQNNHAVWFDVQISSVAIFAGREDVAKKIIEDSKEKRIKTQIDPDGSMPLELKRTLSKHYTLFTLQAFFKLASIGDRIGVDLWHYQTKDGRSIQKALEYTTPYILEKKEWQYKQIENYNWKHYYATYYQAHKVYGNKKYKDVMKKLSDQNTKNNRIHLLCGK